MKNYILLFIIISLTSPLLYARDFFFTLKTEEDISEEIIERRTLPVIDELLNDPGNEGANLVLYEYNNNNRHVRQPDKDVINYKHGKGEKIQSKQP